MSDRAIPRSYANMEGFGIHTFRLINDQGVSRFVKFHWKPKLGVHSLVWDEVQKLAGKNSDYNRQQMWESIEAGNFLEYELGLQVLEEGDDLKYGFDILDATKLIPEELVPVQIVGRMVLNRWTFFWTIFLNNFFEQFFWTIFLNNFFWTIFLEQFFSNNFFWTIFLNNFFEQFFWTIFWTIFFEQFFEQFFWTIFFQKKNVLVQGLVNFGVSASFFVEILTITLRKRNKSPSWCRILCQALIFPMIRWCKAVSFLTWTLSCCVWVARTSMNCKPCITSYDSILR